MADTIRQFLVSIGFAINQSSQRQFTAGVNAANLNVTTLQQSLNAAAAALTNVGTQLTAVAGAPTTKYIQSSQAVQKQQAAMYSQSKLLAKFTAATATAFVEGVRQVAKEYENLYYIAQRTGSTAEGLTTLRFSFQQVGIAGDQALQSFAEFSRIMRTQPGPAGLIRALIRPEDQEYVKKAFGNSVDDITAQYQAFIHRLGDMAPQLQAVYAPLAGLTVDQLANLVNNQKVAAEAAREHAAMLKRLGLDETELDKRSVEFMRHLNTAWDNFSGILKKGAFEAIPTLQSLTDSFTGFLEKVEVFDKLHPGAAFAEGLAIAGAGVLTLDALLGKLTGSFLGLGAASAAFTSLLRLAAPWAAGAAAFAPSPTNEGEDEALRRRGVTPLGPAPGAPPPKDYEAEYGSQAGQGAPKTWEGVWEGIKGVIPHFQGGGIVSTLHEGEAVLPAELTSLLMRSGNRGAELVVLESILEGLRGWWAGSTAYRPVVIPKSDVIFGNRTAEEIEQGARMHGDPFGLGGRARGGSGGAVGKIYPGAGPAGANAANFVSYLINKLGVDRAHAEGMVANALAESSFNPAAKGAAGERGLFQWDKSRWAAYLRSVPADKVFDPYSQLHYAVEEQRKREPSWFKTPMGAERAAASWEHGFERPRYETGRLGFLRQVQEGDKNVTINQTNNVHVQHGDPIGGAAVGRHYMGAHRRMSEDLVRSFRTALG